MQIKKFSLFLLILSILMVQVVPSFGLEEENRSNSISGNTTPVDDFKVIGYYCGEWFDVPVSQLQAEKLTHVMYGFLIPTVDGTCKPFEEPEELQELIQKCHDAGTEVFVSVGGYSEKNGPPLAATFETIGADDQLRETFVDSIIDVVEEYGFDGVEMDWEYPKYTTCLDYEKTIVALSEKLKPMGKGLSTALPGTGSTDGQNVWEALSSVTDTTLQRFDFISLMCYDLNREDGHSPIWFANTTINYWKIYRNVPAEKIVLGMPLYARPSWQQYRFLVDMDPSYAYLDYVATEPLVSTYNGLNTLREKTMIALRSAGGVMLFDVNEDTYDETSVVSMINDTLGLMKNLTNEQIKNYLLLVVDNQLISFEPDENLGMPFIDENSRTLVPLRKVIESIGGSVGYTTKSGYVSTVTVTIGKDRLELTIGSNTYLFNGNSYTMDTEAIIKEGRTYLPLRPVLEAFGYQVTYSAAGKCIYAVMPSDDKN